MIGGKNGLFIPQYCNQFEEDPESKGNELGCGGGTDRCQQEHAFHH